MKTVAKTYDKTFLKLMLLLKTIFHHLWKNVCTLAK